MLPVHSCHLGSVLHSLIITLLDLNRLFLLLQCTFSKFAFSCSFLINVSTRVTRTNIFDIKMTSFCPALTAMSSCWGWRGEVQRNETKSQLGIYSEAPLAKDAKQAELLPDESREGKIRELSFCMLQ